MREYTDRIVQGPPGAPGEPGQPGYSQHLGPDVSVTDLVEYIKGRRERFFFFLGDWEET